MESKNLAVKIAVLVALLGGTTIGVTASKGGTPSTSKNDATEFSPGASSPAEPRADAEKAPLLKICDNHALATAAVAGAN